MGDRILYAVCAAVLLAPLPAVAQEEPSPMLAVSQFKCDWNHVSDIVASVDSVAVPVWEELRQEGLLMSAGIFVHQWGDEWNVGLYRVAPDRESFFEAFEEEGRRITSRHPDVENPMSEYCGEHRDNIYSLGPNVGPGTEGDPGSM